MQFIKDGWTPNIFSIQFGCPVFIAKSSSSSACLTKKECHKHLTGDASIRTWNFYTVTKNQQRLVTSWGTAEAPWANCSNIPILKTYLTLGTSSDEGFVEATVVCYSYMFIWIKYVYTSLLTPLPIPSYFVNSLLLFYIWVVKYSFCPLLMYFQGVGIFTSELLKHLVTNPYYLKTSFSVTSALDIKYL